MFNDFISGEIKKLESGFEVRQGINHQGVKGTSNEEIFKELLEKVIPAKYKIAKNSIIQDVDGNQSNEADLVIYTEDFLPPFFLEVNKGFIPVECVKYVFEIKTTLNKTELFSTIEKFKRLKKFKNFSASLGLFAFTTDLKKKKEIERYLEIDEEFLYNPPIHFLCVLNKTYIFFHHEISLYKNLRSKESMCKSLTNKNFNFLENATLTVNGMDYDKIYYNVYKWHEFINPDKINPILFLLVNVSNNLTQKDVGNYIFPSNYVTESILISVTYVDCWDNKSYSDIDFNGLKIRSLSNEFSSIGGKHKISFKAE